jgi:cellulose synthase/poly-beta-1,6-N-acetylglucosamine synthase-like glycosyltransferase
MYSVILIIFLISVFFILHTYLFYPVGMMALFSKPGTKIEQFAPHENLPSVAVLIAAYNEEKVIREKIISVFNTTYPLSKIKVYVGSDASLDSTETIVSELKHKYPNLELIKFGGRVGKISIINHLQSLGEEDILIMTDANVIFRPATLFELVKMFKDERVGIVAANIVKESLTNEGIAFQEKKYLSLENRIKACESNAFNLIMGAEGGCYAIRNNLFSKVPSKFIVDDFFITMQVLVRGKYTLFNPLALCMEDVPTGTAGEYQRKVRISSGNFQNLFFFKKLLIAFWRPIGFTFWSHKVLRWLTPFFLFISLICSAILIRHEQIFIFLFWAQLIGFLIPVIDHFVSFRNKTLKFISHFYLMNFALLQGFVKFTRGIKSSVWQPVKRNV